MEIYATVLAKGFIEDLGEANINIIQLRHEANFRQSLIFNRNITNTRFSFQITYIFSKKIICR